MTCLTPEQLAAFALGRNGAAEPLAHIAECETCRASLTKMRQLTDRLSAAHAALEHSHVASRARLLTALSSIPRPTQSASAPSQPKPTLIAVLNRHRFAAGGLGLSTAAGALLLLAIFATTSTKLSAMDRMLTAVREVTSYSFNQEDHTTFVAPDGKRQTFHHENCPACWRAPDEANKQWLGDLHAELKSWHTPIVKPGDPAADDSAAKNERLTLHLVETYPCGKPSLIAIYTEGFYFWAPPIPAGDLPTDNTIAKLRAVQQGHGKIVCDLGTKRIDDREARGYVLSFDDAVPFHGDGPVEVWVDPQTDLPTELSYQRTDKEEEGQYISVYRLSDIRWNVSFPPDQFATMPPAGLTDATPPTDEKDVAQIIAALRLYADLSGGHYPPIHTIDSSAKSDPASKTDPSTKFVGKLIRDEMLKLAGFTGAPQPAWSQDPKYQQIEAATPGLDWLTRILLDRFHAGFHGTEVTPQDKDKVLLWCTAGERDIWRIIYGNLRTEVVRESKLKELVPTAMLP